MRINGSPVWWSAFVVSFLTIHLLVTYITVEMSKAFHGSIDNFCTVYAIHRYNYTPINQ
jgi:hypothetical protein